MSFLTVSAGDTDCGAECEESQDYPRCLPRSTHRSLLRLPRQRCLITTRQCVSTQEAIVSHCGAAVNICKAPGGHTGHNTRVRWAVSISLHVPGPRHKCQFLALALCQCHVRTRDLYCLVPTCGRSLLTSPGLAAWSSLSAGRRVKYYRISWE